LTAGKRLVFVAVVVFGVALDLWSKHVAFEALAEAKSRGQRDIVVVEGFFHLHEMRNPGMAWSLFQNVDRRVWIAIRGTLSLVLIVVWWTRPRLSWWANLAFAFVVAGALGNLYDNGFAPGGHVRDFLLFIFWGWSFPVFNVADAMITIGAPALLLYFAEPRKATTGPAGKPESAA
jgi:signal peptidase II